MESTHYAISFGDNRVYPKTVDLATCGRIIFLANENESKLYEDLETIKRMEKFEVEKIFEIKK
ncbi:hypothetical protein [uncultured Methanobrevibacter sp.]|uniref:hypothetical protein n=1 Tax=uncultured Methanobrevibacter sp. TaxID=253161 RepID=UPI0025CD4490|nr:hypothetical protein [uncultured Methanobrevibacter sp.]